MKLAELVEGLVHAYRPRTSDSSAQAALVLEQKLWMREDKWANWDGAPTRTKQTIVRRASKGDRAGRSDNYTARSWVCGVPALIIDGSEYLWTPARGERQLAWSPAEIFERALSQMNPFKLISEGHDGRFSDDIRPRMAMDVPTVGGDTDKVHITLELIRPQTLLKQWGPYFKGVLRDQQEKATYEVRLDQMRKANDALAADIQSRADSLVGPAESHTSDGARIDLRRTETKTGISKSYVVSEEMLLKLLSLAERSSSQ